MKLQKVCNLIPYLCIASLFKSKQIVARNFVVLCTICFATLAAMIITIPAYAQSAGEACSPTKLTSPVWVSTGVGGAGYYLVCDGSSWVELFSTNAGGALTIGRAAGVTCSAATEGAIRYNAVDKNVEVCDGSEWALIRASACDNAPAFLGFPTLTTQVTSTLVTSDILQVTGMDAGCTTNVSISGDGSPSYRVCSDAACSSVLQNWTAANNTLNIQGNYIQLSTTTSVNTDTSFTVTLNTGPTSQDWIV